MFESSISKSYSTPVSTSGDAGFHGPSAHAKATENSTHSEVYGAGSPKNQKLSKALLTEKLSSARKKYEPVLVPENLAIHTKNQSQIAEAVLDFRERLSMSNSSISPEEILLAVEKNIGSILSDARFDPTAYKAANTNPDGYGKYLLFSDLNQGAPFCFQYFRFDGHQKTVIHDHPCDCTSYVVEGHLRERSYRVVDGQLEKRKKDDRFVGSLRAIDLDRNDPHSLKNKSENPAGSVHVYRIDGVQTAAAVLNRYEAGQRQKKIPGARRLSVGLDGVDPAFLESDSKKFWNSGIKV